MASTAHSFPLMLSLSKHPRNPQNSRGCFDKLSMIGSWSVPQ